LSGSKYNQYSLIIHSSSIKMAILPCCSFNDTEH
jgi:hypothetical protein